MHLEVTFDQINKGPRDLDPAIRATFNGKDLYQGCLANLSMKVDAQESNTLRIYFENKTVEDTATNEHGNIINDMNFTLTSVRVDRVEFEALLWKGQYVAREQTFPGCLFFGPEGYYEIVFDYPILKWQLRERNEPGWEEDYYYYETACKILNRLPGH